MLIILSDDGEVNSGPNIADLSNFYLNMRSIRNKMDYIDSICHENDIICSTETHLDDRMKNNDLVLEGYCDSPSEEIVITRVAE